MTREQLEGILRSTPDPREREYRPRRLPTSLAAAQMRLASPRGRSLHAFAAGVAGAVVGIALVVFVAVMSGNLASSREAGGPLANPESSEADASRPCLSSDFDIRSEPWPDAPMAGGLLVIFEARESATCTIDKGLHALVTDADGQGLGGVSGLVREAIAVTPGTTWQAGIAWSTYCGSGGGMVAAPEEPVRPFTLSVGLDVVIDHTPDGVEVTTADAMIPVATSSDIAPGPCADDPDTAPFALLPTGFSAYPGPLPGT